MNPKTESFKKTKPFFSSQELVVLNAMELGHDNAWGISNSSCLLITSVRRALNNLTKKGKVVENGIVWHKPTQRNVTKFKLNKIILTLF